MDHQQINLFSSILEEKKITKPIRLIEFFAGIGSQYKALKQITDKVESYKICEWAYNSIIAYNHIHIKDFTDYSKDKSKEELINYLDGNISIDYNEPCDCTKKQLEWLKSCYNSCIATHNLMNIMKVHSKDLEIVESEKYEYILTYSFPCQDLSLAGLGKGMSVSQADGGTRSGLLWEVERILSELHEDGKHIDVLLMENVPQVIGTNNVKDFQKWELKLEKLGYSNYIQILNAKNYGIPQNRQRCFMVSLLGDYDYYFPREIQLKYRLKDFLEKNVDEKYYLSEKDIERISNWNAYEKPLDNVIDTSERESNKCIDNSLWKRQCGNETCESSEMKYICDYRYDEGIRGRENYELCSSLTCKGTGFSGIPLITNKKMRKRLKQ